MARWRGHWALVRQAVVLVLGVAYGRYGLVDMVWQERYGMSGMVW